jgi:5'-deoxynucleotidase YfbR-like HD superfamily hydrolase
LSKMMGAYGARPADTLGSVGDMFEFKAREAIPPMKLADQYRCDQVTRFHMVKTDREQNLAEHQYNVAMLAKVLAEKLKIPDGNVIKLALIHDRHEVITGDIPTPFKEHVRNNSDYFFLGLVKKVDPEYYALRRDMTLDELAVVDMADMVEALVFLTNNTNDAHGNAVLSHINKKLNNFVSIMDEKGVGTRWRDAISELYKELLKDTEVDADNY